MTRPRCRTIEVDGMTVRVRGAGDWTEADYAAFEEVVRAALRKVGKEPEASDADGQ